MTPRPASSWPALSVALGNLLDILKQKRSELARASTPRREFMSGFRQHLRRVLDDCLFEELMVGVDVAGILATAATAEYAQVARFYWAFAPTDFSATSISGQEDARQTIIWFMARARMVLSSRKNTARNRASRARFGPGSPRP